MLTSTITTLVYNLVIPQNVDWPGVAFTILGPDGSPADLTGCSALGEIRRSAGDTLYYTWSTSPTTGQGLITLDTVDSTLIPRVLASESAPWTFARAAYDIVVTNPAAPVGLQKSRVVMGVVSVSPAVTV